MAGKERDISKVMHHATCLLLDSVAGDVHCPSRMRTKIDIDDVLFGIWYEGGS